MNKKSDKTYVSGPTNVVRLEGQIGTINKVLYLYMDYHIDPHYQYNCDDIRSVDLRQHFINTFNQVNNTDKRYDFFSEFPAIGDNYYHSRKGQYLDEISNFFLTQIKKNTYTNVHFNYMDIRYLFGAIVNYFKTLDPLLYNIRHTIHELSVSVPFFDNMIEQLSKVKLSLEYLSSVITELFKLDHKANIRKPADPFYMKTLYDADRDVFINYFMNKLIHAYDMKHVGLKSLIRSIIQKYVLQNIHLIIEKISEVIKYVTDFKKLYNSMQSGSNINESGQRMYLDDDLIVKKLSHMYAKIKKINVRYLSLHSLLMDLYFIRRFAGKDYITNAINYAGQWHSTDITYILVKYLGFKITHVANNTKPLDTLTSEVKNSKLSNIIKLSGIFDTIPVNQCSDITDFPKLFS